MSSSATDVHRLLQVARLHLAQGGLDEAVEKATEVIRLDGKQPAATSFVPKLTAGSSALNGHWLISLLPSASTRTSPVLT
jgi:hypothetical protein